MIETREVSNEIKYEFEFSFCTLMTKKHEYEKLLDSLEKKGFNSENSEFLYLDNSISNKYDAFKGLRQLIANSKGEYIVLLHQDIILYDDINILRKRISELEKKDKNWAVAGNAGAREPKNYFIKVTDRNNNLKLLGKNFPALVNSLDEDLIILKKNAGITFSNDLSGFHFYGTDICMNAQQLGFNCYVIDFHVLHYGFGVLTKDFYESKNLFVKKYAKLKKGKFIQTTCIRFYIGSGFARFFWNWSPALFLAKEFYRFKNIISS